ncbi:MAG: biopolymer transporter ExbD [Deltaproteobacteria bacterium]|nr:biopolymer transporter ExbD [Deltaproteobacteria bacterium]
MKRFRRREAQASVGLDVGALAPMVDMMTLLLLFLLRTYSTELAPTPPSGPFALAPTSSEESRHGGIEILVANDAIYVDGQRIAAWDYVGTEGVVKPLYDRLLASRTKARAEVHADGTVPWRRLGRVLATAQAAGLEELAIVGGYRGSL